MPFLSIFVIALIVPLLVEVRPSRHPLHGKALALALWIPIRRPREAGLGATRTL